MLEVLWILTKLCVVKGTWSKTSTRSSSPIREVESVFQSIRNFLLWTKKDLHEGRSKPVTELCQMFFVFKLLLLLFSWSHSSLELTYSVLGAT